MKDLTKTNNPHGDEKVFDACSIFGMMNLKGERFSAKDPIRAMANMHDRGNGLGGGFAAYGIYPEYKDDYAFHIMFLDREAKKKMSRLISECFNIVNEEEMPTQEANVTDPPIMWRYFVQPKPSKMEGHTADDFVMEKVTRINTETGKAFVFSSGKNMGVFKGVGFPEDVAEYFCLEDYEGYLWTGHGRFPTNTQGWWGGAHPFSMLDWTVVHNGEISSYGINKRYLEMFGYKCTMHRHRSYGIRLRPTHETATFANRYSLQDSCSAPVVRNQDNETRKRACTEGIAADVRQSLDERTIYDHSGS